MSTSFLARLAALTGTDVDDVTRWVAVGLVEVAGPEPTPRAVEQARLVQALARRGFTVDDIATAAKAQPAVFDQFVDLASAGQTGLRTVEDAAAEWDLDPGFVRRIWEASGLADQGDVGTVDDVASMRVLDAVVKAGLPEDAVVQVVRVYADAMARIAEATVRLFHFHVHERLRAEGVTGDALDTMTASAADQLLPLVEPTIMYFHRKALVRASRDDLVLHLAEEVGLSPPGDVTGQVPLTVLFVDLARYTSMTEAMGDLAAAEVLDRFSALVRRAVMASGGRLVKQIGDEFMLVFSDPASAMPAAFAIRQAARDEPAFLATRIGVHHGPVLCREGDYVGATVNVAARITAQAAADQILVSAGVRDVASDTVEFASLGAQALRGLDRDIEVFEALPTDVAPSHPVDPVCGMVVHPAADTPRLEVGGSYVYFCSEDCRDRYRADPKRYAPAAAR